MKKASKKVLVAMSGGVDSSVAAALLVGEGHDVIGAFMKNWSGCDWESDRRDAMRVAARLGIELLTFDFEGEYRAQIFDYMVREYKAGRTPNPDVLCNKFIKFGLLLERADELGCDFIATGHYARTRIDSDGIVHLLAGKDPEKDQSYFLCRLDQTQLRRAMFPVGDLLKSQVREKARELDLSVAEKKDSQGLCFVGQIELSDFLKAEIPPREGNIVTTNGKVIGRHEGHAYYTIGQRHGLGVGGGEPYFVVERRPETSEIVVAKEDEQELYSKSLIATDVVETYPGAVGARSHSQLEARIRYRQPLQGCVVESTQYPVPGIQPSSISVRFDKPQRAVAPGQFIAFYNGEELIGSGVIESVPPLSSGKSDNIQ